MQAVPFNSLLRVGFAASFSNATGGPDRLFLADSPDVPIDAPEPSALALVGSALVLFGLMWRRKSV